MPKITYVSYDGSDKQTVDVDSGATIMEGAKKNGITGIAGDCGGACACSTCHVYIDEEWQKKIDPIEDMEKDMLEFAYDPKPSSRLSCQLKVTDDLDGLVVHIPERQI